MIFRFCLYSICKNLRFFEPFLILFLLSDARSGGPGLLYFEIGALLGYQKLLTGILEVPSGVATDRWGRRRALMVCFVCYLGAFPLLALSSRTAETLIFLYGGMTLFALGEAFRTGSHKAIILDWLEEEDRLLESTKVFGLTRFFSKLSSGVSALVGALIVYQTGRFDLLFWAATGTAGLGFLVVSSYPYGLEGEQSRLPQSRMALSVRARFQALWAAPGVGGLILQSIGFESQIKVAQHYIQPFLQAGLAARSVSILGGPGALAIGLYYLVQDVLGGTASLLSSRFERRWGGARAANWVCLGLAPILVGSIAVGLLRGWWGMAALGFVLLAVLQNVRRPIFLSLLSGVMDKPQRATTLSIESQARSFAFAILAPVTGFVADRLDLGVTLLLLGAVFAVAAAASRIWSGLHRTSR